MIRNRNRLTDMGKRLVVDKGAGGGGGEVLVMREGWIGSLGLADASYYIQNG